MVVVDEAVSYVVGPLLPVVLGAAVAWGFILAVCIIILWGVRWDWWKPGWLSRKS